MVSVGQLMRSRILLDKYLSTLFRRHTFLMSAWYRKMCACVSGRRVYKAWSDDRQNVPSEPRSTPQRAQTLHQSSYSQDDGQQKVGSRLRM